MGTYPAGMRVWIYEYVDARTCEQQVSVFIKSATSALKTRVVSRVAKKREMRTLYSALYCK